MPAATGSTHAGVRVMLAVDDLPLLAALAGMVEKLGGTPLPVAGVQPRRWGWGGGAGGTLPQMVVLQLTDPLEPQMEAARRLRRRLGEAVPILAFSNYDDLLRRAAPEAAYTDVMPASELPGALVYWLRAGPRPLAAGPGAAGAAGSAAGVVYFRGVKVPAPATTALRSFLAPLGRVVRSAPSPPAAAPATG